jgi:NAD(P)-dependent dehydrogenase (short-subunit alcohol dehydrogenase family)
VAEKAFSLENRLALITGGASGIGEAIASRFLRSGATVIVADIRPPDTSLSSANLDYVALNVADIEQVEKVMSAVHERYGSLDVLINNAGIGDVGPDITDSDPADYRRQQAVNVDGVYYGIKFGAPILKDGGSIINTASLAAFTIFPGYSQYSATKAAVISLTRSAAVELAARGIRVNAVCPGTHRTPMMPDDDPEYDLVKSLAPLNTIGEVEDLAGIYHYLAADESKYLTGQALIVDGGLSAGLSTQARDKLLS